MLAIRARHRFDVLVARPLPDELSVVWSMLERKNKVPRIVCGGRPQEHRTIVVPHAPLPGLEQLRNLRVPTPNAQARGVAHAGSSGRVFGAPRLSRNFTILSWPNFAAQASGVDWLCSSRAVRFAPASRSFFAFLRSPSRAAVWRGEMRSQLCSCVDQSSAGRSGSGAAPNERSNCSMRLSGRHCRETQSALPELSTGGFGNAPRSSRSFAIS